MTVLSPSLADERRSQAASVWAWAALSGLVSAAMAVAWLLGTLGLRNQLPEMQQSTGYIVSISPTRFTKDYTYIHLGIKSDSKAGNRLDPSFGSSRRMAPVVRIQTSADPPVSAPITPRELAVVLMETRNRPSPLQAWHRSSRSRGCSLKCYKWEAAAAGS